MELEQCEEYLAWKTEFEKSWCKIMSHPICFIKTCFNSDGSIKEFITEPNKQGLINAYEDIKIIKNNKPVKCIKIWLEDPNKLVFESAKEYPPPLVCPPTHFNLWRPVRFPFAASGEFHDLHPDYDVEGVDMWKTHLSVLCNHEQSVCEYVLRWIAHGFQRPFEKIGCMLTFVSGQGAGKTMFIDSLKAIYGQEKCVETPSPERDCWGAFNGVMDGKFLVVLSEVDRSNSTGSEGRVKQFLTDSVLMINPKGRPQYQAQSFHRFIQLSNSNDPVSTDEDDRRNLIIRCSDEKKGDFEYFSKLAERLRAPNTLRSVYYWLMHKVDLSDWAFRSFPRTTFHLNIIEANTDPVEEFMKDFTYKHLEQETVALLGTEMFHFYREWSKATGTVIKDGRGKPANDSFLVSKLQNMKGLPQEAMVVKRTNKGNKRVYNMGIFKARYNIFLDEDDGEEPADKRPRLQEEQL
eukprot:gene36030-46818_t